MERVFLKEHCACMGVRTILNGQYVGVCTKQRKWLGELGIRKLEDSLRTGPKGLVLLRARLTRP